VDQAMVDYEVAKLAPSDSGELFWRSHILQQLADVGRAQGILTVAVDALIFATRHSLREQKLQGLVALRTDRVFALRHLYRQYTAKGQEHSPSARALAYSQNRNQQTDNLLILLRILLILQFMDTQWNLCRLSELSNLPISLQCLGNALSWRAP
jgi:hypothetical protein